MKIAFKKEWLFKYKFWLMLAVIPPAACAAIFILESAAGDYLKTAAANRDQATKSKLPLPSPPVNDPGIKLISDEAARVKSEELTVWKKAYAEEASIFRLPPGFVAKVHADDGLFLEDVRVLPKKLAECPPDQFKQTDKDKAAADKDKDKNAPGLDQAIFVHGEVQNIKEDHFLLKVRDAKSKTKFTDMTFLKTATVKIKDAKNLDLDWTRIRKYDVVSVFFQRGKYFGDRFVKSEREEFKNYYRTQLPAIIDQIEPLNPAKGEGVVQLADFGYDKVLQLKKWAAGAVENGESVRAPEPSKAFHFMPSFNMDKVESSDDIWIAQENLWIQEELFRLVRVANDYVSKFDRMDYPKNAKGKEGVFQNPYWKIELKLIEPPVGDAKLQAKFTNLLTRRQKLDFKLKVLMNEARNADAEVITLPPGLPLEPTEAKGGTDSQTVTVALKSRSTRTGIFRVDQVLTWETAAVRKVEAIHIAKVGNVNAAGHRNYPDALLPYPNRWAPPATAGAAPAPPAKDKDGKPLPADPKLGAMAMGGKTPNDQLRERYTSVPEQLRRLPVAVVLIVEQGQVDRVQTAFNNSRFRFLTEQVLMTHYPGSCRPPAFDTAPAVVAQDPMKIGAFPGKDPAANKEPIRQRAAASVNDELEANVELVIYGIITIYERIPGRDKNPSP